MTNKLVVLSFDALQSDDLATLGGFPHGSEIMEKAAIVEHLHEIYPTLTYPIHTTMITGVYPDRHGIPHNQRFSLSPEVPDWSILGSDWYWQRKYLKAKTLPDAVFEQGGRVATVIWPVLAGERRWTNVPQIWPLPGQVEQVRSLYEASSSPNVMEIYYDRYIGQYDWKINQDMADHAVDIGCDILKEERPDLFLCHILHLDHARHIGGTYGSHVVSTLRLLDIFAGRFLAATKEAGTYDRTNFVFLGDHGQIPVVRAFALNVALQKEGLCKADGNGHPVDYLAYGFSAGYSVQIMVRHPEDAVLLHRVYEALMKMQRQYPTCIEHVYTAEEAEREEGLSGSFSFVVEGTEGTLFRNEVDVPLVVFASDPSYTGYRSMHGHHPDKGPKPPLVAFGPDIEAGKRVEKGRMIDVCPTLAALCGVDMPGMEGSPLPIILPAGSAS